MTKTIAALVFSMGLLVSTSAQAGFVYADLGGAAQSNVAVPANNDFQAQLAAVGLTSFNLGTSLALTGLSGSVTAYYYGKEAGFTNQFYFNGSLFFTNTGASGAWGASGAPMVGSFGGGTGAVLDFEFCAVTIAMCLANSANDNTMFNSVQSIGIWIDPNDSNVAWLLWDDSGANEDDDHDDMIIKLVYQVPEPGTLALLGLGLMGLGFASRRRKS